MQTTFLRIYLSCTILIFLSTESKSQIFRDRDASLKVAGSSLVKINENRQTVDYVKLTSTVRISEQDNLTWLSTQLLKTENGISFQLSKKENDHFGNNQYRYNQYYKSLKVEYGVYYVHIHDGLVESANGEFYNQIRISEVPTISKETAFAQALKFVPSKKYQENNQNGIQKMKENGELLILPTKSGYALAYKFDIYSLDPLKRVYIYIDANTGQKIKEINRICTADAHGTAVTAYSGTQQITTDSISPTNFKLSALKGFGGVHTWNLNNGTSYSSATNFFDSNNFWNATSLDQYAYDAHFGAEATYDFYQSRFGRNSYDNAGAQLNSYVHYSTGFVNAFWDGTEMTYGDGDGIDYNPLTSLDIVGHEITHAVTENTAALVYSDESGALNEAFSDCFGVTIDYFKNPTTANFLEGDQININGIPFRNMGNPNQYNNPDTYNGLYWNNPNEVHNNSGVMNYWYYLICMGGTGVNDLGNSFSINQIGLTDASAIIYRSLSIYLTPNSTYADARFYSIQAAIDLYGSCSEQVIQVTNAWYAVGVGGLFSNAVVAGFSTSQNYFCVIPATVNFSNLSFNATSFHWDFGDGTTSTLTSPSHIYTTVGTYSVTLIAVGTALCGNTDTITISNYITTINGSGPISPSCTPNTISFCCGVGISNVHLNTINKTSNNASEGYKDFTCGNSTILTAGDNVSISITTSNTTNENVKVWIDYNNDGVFNNTSELVFTSNNKLISHAGIINTSVNAVLNTPLRMRVIDDNALNTITGPCYNSLNGQTEDYTITFIANTLPPIANFTSDFTVINLGGVINYKDLSQHAPSSWAWTFTGGTLSSSTSQNPIVTYNTIGTYRVKLVVTNSFGQDSIIKIAYIHVVNSFNLCSGVSVSNAPNGQLYDSGGLTGSYLDNENCSFLIDPGCATSIAFTFTQFNTESGFDLLYIYNGINSSAPLLWSGSGSVLPPNLTATSGKIYIVWNSDVSITSSGFEASWTSVIGSSTVPVAGFSVNNVNPALGIPVLFTDTTTGTPYNWSWDFGDGQSSTQKNPSHSYASSGTFNVKLIATNCVASDTASKIIIVQSAPIISVNPDSIFVNLNCSDSITIPLTIYNTGTGDLLFTVEASATISDTVQVLVFMSGVDTIEEYPRTLSAISQYFTRYKVTKLYSTVANDLQIALQGKDVLLFPEDESGILSSYSQYAAIVQAFVASGKRIIICGSGTTGGSQRIFTMGLFTGTYINTVSTINLTVLDTTDEITKNVPLFFIAPNATFYNDITNTDKIKLVEYGTNDVVCYRNIGLGKAIYIGFDYFAYGNEAARIVSNSIYGVMSTLSDWIQTPQQIDTISPGDSLTIYVQINSTGLNAGTYNGQILISSNDPINPNLSLSVNLQVSGQALMALSDTCFNFGTATQFTTTTDTLTISNNGCDTLRITSSSSNNAVFTLSPATFTVAPGNNRKVNVLFQPITVGTFSGIITIQNNDHDTTICLNGASVAAPVIKLHPNILNVNLNACNDSISVPIYILNTGGSNLVWNTAGSNNTSINVLALNYGADLTTEYPNTIAAINNQFTNYTLTTTQTIDPIILQGLLTNIDVLLFPEQETGNTTFYSTLSTVVQNFVQNGGTVIICGSYSNSNENRIYDMGLFTGNFVGFQNGGGICNVLDTTLDIVNNVSPTFNAANATFYHNITNTDKIEAVSYNGSDVVTYRNIGLGRAIFIGWDFFTDNNDIQLIIANSIRYFNPNNLASWLTISSIQGTTIPGDSTLNYVTFYSNGLNGGTYTTNILINSNDPLKTIDTLQVTLNIANNPCANFIYQAPTSCNGTIAFSNTSKNAPTTWFWDFGDGLNSSLQNPSHTYASVGTFQVKLVVCNATSCDSINKNVIVTALNGPVATSCTPTTGANCCGMGITNVQLNSINNTTLDGSEGYKDFTCTTSTLLNVGAAYSISITTGSNYSENVRAWIDYNNNGIYTAAENISSFNTVFNTNISTFTVPTTATLNTPLRMRVIDDYSSNIAPGPCTNIQYGQCEDYTIVITNFLPPVVNFTKTVVDSCSRKVQFNDISTNFPTSWLWTFGDGDSSTLKNPIHYYANSGTYTATLIAINPYGSDTISKTLSLNINAATISISGLLVIGQQLSFTGTANGAISYSWNFGDGNNSLILSTQHAYAAAGIYYPSLTINYSGCSITLTDTLAIIPVGIIEIGDENSFTTMPNPFHEELALNYTLSNEHKVSLIVLDAIGQTIKEYSNKNIQQAGKYSYQFKPESAGIYFLHFSIDGFTKVYKVVKED